MSGILRVKVFGGYKVKVAFREIEELDVKFPGWSRRSSGLVCYEAKLFRATTH